MDIRRFQGFLSLIAGIAIGIGIAHFNCSSVYIVGMVETQVVCIHSQKSDKNSHSQTESHKCVPTANQSWDVKPTNNCTCTASIKIGPLFMSKRLCFAVDMGYAYGFMLSEEISNAYHSLLDALIGRSTLDQVR